MPSSRPTARSAALSLCEQARHVDGGIGRQRRRDEGADRSSLEGRFAKSDP